MRLNHQSRHFAIAVTASLAALAWAAAPAGARAGWTAATDVLVAGRVAQFAQPAATTEPTTPATSSNTPTTSSDTPTTDTPTTGIGTGGSGGSAGAPTPVLLQNPNKAKNGSIIGIGKPPAQVAQPAPSTAAPVADPTTAAPAVPAPTAAAPTAPAADPVTEAPAPVVEATQAPAADPVTEAPAPVAVVVVEAAPASPAA